MTAKTAWKFCWRNVRRAYRATEERRILYYSLPNGDNPPITGHGPYDACVSWNEVQS